MAFDNKSAAIKWKANNTILSEQFHNLTEKSRKSSNIDSPLPRNSLEKNNNIAIKLHLT
jgi:hypothetical protein